MDTGLLVARVVFGVVMAAHGSQKLFGWFGGYGLAGTGGFFEQLGFRPGRTFAALAGSDRSRERAAPGARPAGPSVRAAMMSVMLVAALTVHWTHGLFAQNNGVEVPLLYATLGLALAFTGYGAYSLDAALGLDALWTPRPDHRRARARRVGGVVNVALRRPAAAHAAA